MKITTIGSGMVDIYVRSTDFAVRHQGQNIFLCQLFGSKIEIDDCIVTSGGGATNTAVAFARQGHQVSCVIETGQDVFAKQIKEDLKIEDVDTSQVISEENEKTGFSVILVGTDGRRTVMVNRGASALLDAKDLDLDYLAKRQHLHLSSVGGRKAALHKLWKVFAMSPDIGFSWNPGKTELELLNSGQLLLPPLKQGIFIVNLEEWHMIPKLQTEILKLFWLVVITNGGRGGQVYLHGEKPWHFNPALAPRLVDETGAGDAFCSGLVSGLLDKKTVKQAVTQGVNAAGKVIGYLGAKKGLPYQKK